MSGGSDKVLEGRAINKSFGRKVVLKDINTTIVPGQICALVGPSGSGKSTLLRTLSLLDPPDSGSITVDNRTYVFPRRNGNGIEPPWPKVTIVFQQLFLWPHLTMRENITLPLTKLNGASPNGVVNEMIDLFDMGEFVDRYPNEGSLGQRQRVAIARALALHPRYLLLDEITSALDVEHVSRMLAHLKTLREQGTGIMLVTHLIGFAKRAADQVLFMEHGAITEAGGPEILSSPKSSRLASFLSLVDAAS